MKARSYAAMGFTTLIALGAATRTLGGDCCAHCRREATCQKVCRLVCEEKKVEIICWGCKCEPFCLPTRSTPGCEHCATVCESCDDACQPDGVCSAPKKFVWTDWIPGCANLHVKKKLMQKKVTKTVPSYKWVVEDLCPECGASCQCASAPPGVVVPPAPVGEGLVMGGAVRTAVLPTTAR